MGTEAEVANEPEVRKRVLCEERINLFDQWEKGSVQIVVVVGELGVKKAGIDIADRNEFKGGMRGEEDVGGDPIGGFPMPFGIRGTDKFSKVGTPVGEGNGRYVTGVSQVVFFDCARGVSELKLGDLRAVLLEEEREAFAGVAEVRREDGDVCEEWHVP